MGYAFTLDSTDTIGETFLEIESDIRAVLVRKKGTAGAIRVTGGEVLNIVTGPQEDGAVIVFIEPGQTGMCLGRASFRRFREKHDG
ncbi:hypothetical protein EK21DRAFT_77789 [Setomelanomma holmii]|uniref:Uncharacterized protein n=1 Tax=Setomelanomma holmii TaxID=210430 RepID=A0A9P4H0H8_9PLEO|nr:hypothetical protein EK21DRAFT_77789 [Setomelanomma holmii]